MSLIITENNEWFPTEIACDLNTKRHLARSAPSSHLINSILVNKADEGVGGLAWGQCSSSSSFLSSITFSLNPYFLYSFPVPFSTVLRFLYSVPCPIFFLFLHFNTFIYSPMPCFLFSIFPICSFRLLYTLFPILPTISPLLIGLYSSYSSPMFPIFFSYSPFSTLPSSMPLPLSTYPIFYSSSPMPMSYFLASSYGPSRFLKPFSTLLPLGLWPSPNDLFYALLPPSPTLSPSPIFTHYLLSP